jgi:hypothetical protein
MMYVFTETNKMFSPKVYDKGMLGILYHIIF